MAAFSLCCLLCCCVFPRETYGKSGLEPGVWPLQRCRPTILGTISWRQSLIAPSSSSPRGTGLPGHAAMDPQLLEHLCAMGMLILVCAISLVLKLGTTGEGNDNVPTAPHCPLPAAATSDPQPSSPISGLGSASGDAPAGGEAEGCAPGQPIPGWEGVWEGLGRCLRQFSPPTVWDFTPEEARRPAEVAERLNAGCLVYAEKRQQLLALCWGLAYAYRAFFQQPHGGKPASASKHVQTDVAAEAEPRLSATSEEKQRKQRSTPLVEEGAGQPQGGDRRRTGGGNRLSLLPRGGARGAERFRLPAGRAARRLAAPVLGHGGQQPGSGRPGSAAAGVPHEGPSHQQGDQGGGRRPQLLEAAPLGREGGASLQGGSTRRSGPPWRKVVYSDLDNDRVSKDPDDVRCSRAVWRRLARGAMPAYACALAPMDWPAAEVPTVEELSRRLLRAQESFSACGTTSARLPRHHRQLEPEEL